MPAKPKIWTTCRRGIARGMPSVREIEHELMRLDGRCDELRASELRLRLSRAKFAKQLLMVEPKEASDHPYWDRHTELTGAL